MPSGPTQNYDSAAAGWRPRPALATAVRVALAVGPLLFALVIGGAAARWLPPSRLGVPVALWLLLVVVVTSAMVFAASRWLRRLAPLSVVLRLSLVLPDDVPSRFALARRTWSPASLTAPGREDVRRGHADVLLSLVAALAAHDSRTRVHGERVQAYAALIGGEMGLSEDDVERLSWVALLHDVGKLHVPAEVINKAGRPSEQEWEQLQGHPAHGRELVRPLRGWLGDWLDGVEQHHERWDGKGYPRSLAGEQISLAARIIAVADTYDVITSARAYKRPMSAEQARAEITRCSGAQFDPAVVRALLSVGIGRLRKVAGPATLLAGLPVLVAAPAQAATTVGSAVQVASGHALTAVLAAGVGVSGGAGAAEVLPAPPAVVASQHADPHGASSSPSRSADGPRARGTTADSPASTTGGAPGGAGAPEAPPTATTTGTPPTGAGTPAGREDVEPNAALTDAPTTAPSTTSSTTSSTAPVPAAPGASAHRVADGGRPTAPEPAAARPTGSPSSSGRPGAAPTATPPGRPAATGPAGEAARKKAEEAAKAAADRNARAAKEQAEAAKAAQEAADRAARAAKDAADRDAKAAQEAADRAAKAAKDAVGTSTAPPPAPAPPAPAAPAPAAGAPAEGGSGRNS